MYKFTDLSNRVVSDGNGWSGLITVPEVQEWIALGNTPLPADSVPVIVPHLTPRQFRQALNQLGLRPAVETASSAADQNTKDWYQYSTYFDRTNAVLNAMATQLGKTSTDIDALWAVGITL
jgi:hypothetical protein